MIGLTQCTKEPALEPLSPREIQFRVRAGESPEAIAESTGWPLDRVTRYAEPPLGERAYVADRAQSTYIHLTRGGATLAEVITNTTGSTDLEWDSFYTNGQWVVSASVGMETAHWTFEPTGNTVHPINDTARSWMGLEPVRPVTGRPVPDAQASDTVVLESATTNRTEPVRLVAVPDSSESSSPQTSVPEISITERAAPPATPQKKSKRGRAKVPSWDEILFGEPRNPD